jgi:hypothetical protein
LPPDRFAPLLEAGDESVPCAVARDLDPTAGMVVQPQDSADPAARGVPTSPGGQLVPPRARMDRTLTEAGF